MKKSLSLVVALAMVFSLLTPAMAFAATSAERSAGAELEKLGVLKGDGEGELYLDNELNRQDMIVLLSRLMGVEDEVEEYGNTHGWEDVTDPYYDSYISWAKEEGLTIGVGDGSEFGYNEQLSVQELLTFMVRALGYEGDWDEVPELAVELGLIDEDADLEATATRGAMAVVTLQTLNTPVKDSNKTLGAHLGLDGFEPVFNETTAEALNLIQVEVVLEDGFNESEAKKKNNYKLDDVRVDSVDLDGNVALLTLNKAHKNKSDNVLEINSRVTGEKLKLDLYFSDTTVPEVTDAAVIGKNVVKVKFSEPINFDVDNINNASREKAREFEAKMDNKRFLVKKVEVINHGAEANVYFHGSFSEGTLEFKIGDGLDDFAGFSLVTDPMQLEVVEDDTPPTVVDFKDAKRGEVTLIFDEDITVEGKLKDFYHTNKKNTADDFEVSGNELTLFFTGKDNNLPDGRAYVYIATEAVANLWGVENDQTIRFEIEVTEDNEGPVVEEVKVKSGEIVVVFNEALDDESAEESDNFVLIDEDGDEVKNKLRKPSLEKNDEVVLKFRGTIDEGTYTLEISGVKDLAGNKMSKYSEEIEIDGTDRLQAPDEALLEKKSDERIITIDFGRAMEVDGKYSVIDPDNYSIQAKNKKTYLLSELEEEFDAYVSIDAYDNNEIVEIVVQDVDTDKFDIDFGANQLTIYRVADEKGNITEGSKPIRLVDKANEKLAIESVEAISKDEIKIKFKQNLDQVGNDFYVHYTQAVLTDQTKKALYPSHDWSPEIKVATVNQTGDREVILELASELNTDATYTPENSSVAHGVYVIITDDGTENRYGLKLDKDVIYEVADGIEVEVADEKVTADSYEDEKDESKNYSIIRVEFSEPVYDTFTKGSIIVNGEEDIITNVTFNKDANNYGTVLIIEVKGLVYKGDSVEINTNLFDIAGNKVDGLDLEIDKVTEHTL